MKSFFTLMLALVVCAPLLASPCDEDIDRYCSDREPGIDNLGHCLDNYRNDVSYQCREWLKKVDDQLRRLGDMCGWAARENCRDIRPGFQRLEKCLSDNYDKLPPNCRAALDEFKKYE